MFEMKITPKSTFPDSFTSHSQSRVNQQSNFALDLVSLLTTLYHPTFLMVLAIILLVIFIIGVFLKKYNDLQKNFANLEEAHKKLAEKNQELELQHCKSLLTSSSQYDYGHEQQDSNSSGEIKFNNGDANFYSGESNSESSTDTAQEHGQIGNDSSSINFSPESKRPGVSSINNSLTPMHLLYPTGNDTKAKQHYQRQVMKSSYSPYNPHLIGSPVALIKTLSFEKTNKNQSHQHQHESQRRNQNQAHSNNNRGVSSSHILIEDQEGDRRNIRESSKLKCNRNLFAQTTLHQHHSDKTQEFSNQFLKLNRIKDHSSTQRSHEQEINFTFDRVSEVENDPYCIMTQNSKRQLLSDRTHLQRQYRQASVAKKETQPHNFRLPNPVASRKMTSFQEQRPQTNSLSRQAFKRTSLFSPTLQFQAPNAAINLTKQPCYQLPQNPAFSPYNQPMKGMPKRQGSNQDVSPKINFQSRDNQKIFIAHKNSAMNVKHEAYSTPYYDLTNLEQDSKCQEFHSARSFDLDDFQEFPLEEQELEEQYDHSDLEEIEEQLFATSNMPNDISGYSNSDNYEDDQIPINNQLLTYRQTPHQIKSPAICPMVHEFQHMIKQKSSSPVISKLPFGMYIEEEENDKENFPCLVYLENGRYKNSFEELQFLGKGGFGVAHKVRHKLDQKFYAIKKIRIHLGQGQDIKEHKVYREIMALPQLNHKNVVRYFGCWAERINSEDEEKINQRVKKIKQRLASQRKPIHKIKEQKKEYKVSRFDEKKKKQEKKDSLIKLNEFNMEAELDEAFENKSTFSHSSSGSEKDSDRSGSDDGSVHSYSSYDNESGTESEDIESEDDLISQTIQYDEEDDSESSKMEKFDDEALIEFIKKDQKFISIDLMIQMEFCSGSTLQEHLDEPHRIINRQENYTFFKQLLQAVKHIHASAFIHRDLKPPNIFIEGNALKVGDFGLARRVNSHHPNIQKIQQALSSTQKLSPKAIKTLSQVGIKKYLKQQQQSLLTTQVGTSTYLSPEQEFNKTYDEKVDIFALGLILCEMYSKFSTLHERITTLNDLKYHGKLPAEMLAKYPIECQIIKMMTSTDPNSRPSAVDLLKSPLLEQWSRIVLDMDRSPHANPQEQIAVTQSHEVLPTQQSPMFSKEHSAPTQVNISNNSIKEPTLINEIGGYTPLYKSQSSLLFKDEITAELEHSVA